jgi:hypothetical protein
MILAALTLAVALTAPVEILSSPAMPPPAEAPGCAAAEKALKALNDAAQAQGVQAPPLHVACQGGKAVRIIQFPELDGFGGKGFNIYHPVAGCQDIQRRVTEDQRETLKKLGRLPNGVLMYAVERKVGPCAVPTPMGYHPPSLPGAADQAPH